MDLQELYDELREMDITDPLCMDKVFAYYDEINREVDEYMQVLVQKLSHAIITWDQPWYQLTSQITRNKIENREGMPKFLLDPLTKDECELIKKNWRKLVKKFHIPDKLTCFAQWKNKTQCRRVSVEENVRRFINSYLARGLKRTIPQVHQYVVNQIAYPPKGRYTEDEEKVMEICFYHNPHKAVQISARVLNRGPRGILQKFYETINGKPENSRIKWNISLATQFIKLLMEYTGESLEGLLNKHFPISVWREVASHFGTQAHYLRHFWYTSLHCQLFVKYDVTLRRVRRRVFKILRRSPYKYWTDIRWKEVSAQFPRGFTFQFLYRITVRIFRKGRIHIKLPLEEVVNIGLQITNNKKYGNKRLKTLVLNEQGHLEVVQYSQKL
ncbi:hypothetical protein ABMA28_006848 [Loxostege sticticalis]|uniref:Uncharacterized protein n=1 Tax=Loxostege sticticalis TaxID=481309 RepID=A0ABD0TNP8_LOXSC